MLTVPEMNASTTAGGPVLPRRKVHPLFLLIPMFLSIRIYCAGLWHCGGLYQIDTLETVEQQCRGTLGIEIIRGLKIPFFEYAGDVYSGGSLVEGVLSVPLFLILGPTLFALRCVPVLINLGVFLGWYVLAERFFSRRAAVFTSIFFLLPPPLYLWGASAAIGYHIDAALFAALGYLCLFEILYGEKAEDLRWPVCLGLIFGFGVWFVNTTLLYVAVGIGWWLLHDRRLLLRKRFCIFVVCFLIGGLLWVFQNRTQAFRGLEFLKSGLQYNYVTDAARTFHRIMSLCRTTLPTLFIVDVLGVHRLKYWNVIGAAVCCISLLNLLLRSLRSWSRHSGPPLIAFPVFGSILYVIIVGVTRFRPEPYLDFYMLPLLPFCFVAIGIFVAWLWEGGLKGRLTAYCTLGLWIVPFACGLFLLVSSGYPFEAVKVPGYSYSGLADTLSERHHLRFQEMAPLVEALVRRLPANDAAIFTHGLAMVHSESINHEADILSACSLVPYLREQDRELLCYRAGIMSVGLFRRSLATLAKEAEVRLGQEYFPYFQAGVHQADADIQLLRREPEDRVLHLPFGDLRPYQIIFLDENSFPSSDSSFWTRGKSPARLFLRSRLRHQSLLAELETGSLANQVLLQEGGNARTINLAPYERRRESLPLGDPDSYEGLYYWVISISTSDGYVPILKSESGDMRYLGVKVVLQPEP